MRWWLRARARGAEERARCIVADIGRRIAIDVAGIGDDPTTPRLRRDAANAGMG